MRTKKLAVAGLGVSLVVALLLTYLVAVGAPALLRFDDAVFNAVWGWADPLGWPVSIAAVLGALTSPLLSTVWVLIAAVLLWRRRHVAAAQVLVVSGLLGVATSETVKRLVGRTRPHTATLHRADLTLSFPSGHAMAGIYVYCLLGVVLLGLARGRGRVRAAGWGLLLLGPLIGVSRVVLGVHWASDVLGGWAYGCAVALCAGLLFWSRLAASWSGRSPELSPAAAEPVERGS